ncbi:MAG: hypothetical protein ACTSR2_03570, partial [Candidatus Hodarchaeales archaeon]
MNLRNKNVGDWDVLIDSSNLQVQEDSDDFGNNLTFFFGPLIKTTELFESLTFTSSSYLEFRKFLSQNLGLSEILVKKIESFYLEMFSLVDHLSTKFSQALFESIQLQDFFSFSYLKILVEQLLLSSLLF